ncbi:hypothetical protein Ciccas_005740 [Cichlidogyrus casuarinus]|uniref:Uncharacterized protein n=1 Tax=Cichlidogyrus casuarinus TaxID=1844966 RepID=A0ABD2Q8V2_9PLAT
MPLESLQKASIALINNIYNSSTLKTKFQKLNAGKAGLVEIVETRWLSMNASFLSILRCEDAIRLISPELKDDCYKLHNYHYRRNPKI